MPYNYQQNLYINGSTNVGWVKYDVYPTMDHKLAVGDMISISGQMYRSNAAIGSIYCDVAGMGIYTLGGLFDYESAEGTENLRQLWPGIGYQNASVAKGRTGNFVIGITITQDVIDRLISDDENGYTPNADQGNGIYDYSGYFRFTFTTGSFEQNQASDDATAAVSVSDNSSVDHFAFITDGRDDPVITSVVFGENYVAAYDSKINNQSPYDYLSPTSPGFIAGMSDPKATINFQLDSRDTAAITVEAFFACTDPNGVEYETHNYGYVTQALSVWVGPESSDPVAAAWNVHRFTVPGTYTYEVYISISEHYAATSQTVTGTFVVYPEYVSPTLNGLTIERAGLDNGSIVFDNADLIYGYYSIDSNINSILDQSQPLKIRNDTKLTLSFTRLVDVEGTPTEIDYKHNAASAVEQSVRKWQGLLLNYTEAQWNVDPDPSPAPSVLQLGNEEMFLVTATLTNGIDTLTASAWLEANFAIFNCNAEKNSVGIGKYCDGTFTGLDVDMDAKFRHDVTIVGALTLETSPIEVLWVNPSPRSSISGSKTMSRAVEDGELLICGYRYNGDSTIAGWHNFCFVGADTMTLFAGNASNNRNGTRALTFTANSSSFTVGACTFNNATHNDYLIPNYIAAVKGFKLTSAMLSAWVAPT